MAFFSDNNSNSTESGLAKRLRGSSVGDYSKFNEAVTAASETSKANQAARDAQMFRTAANTSNEFADRDLNNKMRLGIFESNIKRNEKAADLDMGSSENDKNRALEEKSQRDRSFADRAQMAVSQSNVNNQIESGKDLAKIGQRTQIAEQKSAEERAAIAAKAQVSSAILGNRQSYGGYW